MPTLGASGAQDRLAFGHAFQEPSPTLIVEQRRSMESFRSAAERK